MFPYLRTVDRFISDCEKITHKVQTDNSGNYKLVELSDSEYRKWNHVRKGDEYSVGYSIVRACNAKSCGNVKPKDVKGCECVPGIVAWLTNNVLYANKEANFKNKKNGIESLSFSDIKAWCKSVCVYMHDVLKTVNNRNLTVGLEFYVDYQDTRPDMKGVRADVIIGGFGQGHRQKMLVIELKQWSRLTEIEKDAGNWVFYNDPDMDKNPIIQCRKYIEKMENAVRGSNKKAPIVFIPCVYVHNLEKRNINKFPGTVKFLENDTVLTDKNIEYNSEPIKVFLKDSDFSGYIDNVFDEGCSIEVFKEYKKRNKVWDIPAIANILKKGTNTKKITERLHWDQKKVLDSLCGNIFEGKRIREGKTVDIIYGGPGSGKTLLAMLLLRKCRDIKAEGVFAYRSNAVINAFVREFKNSFKKKIEDKNLISELDKVNTVEAVRRCLDTYSNGSISMDDPLKETVKEFRELLKCFIYWEDIKDGQDLVVFDEVQAAKGDKSFKKLLDSKHNHIVFLGDPLQSYNNENLFEIILKKKKSFEKKGYAVREYYLWSHFRCHADEGYVTWVEQILSISDNARPGIIMPYVSGRKEAIYYKNLDFQPKAFFCYDTSAKKTFDKISNPSDFLYLRLIDRKYSGSNTSERRMNDIIDHLTGELHAENRLYGLSAEGDQAKVDSVRGLEYKKVMVIIGPELYIDNKTLKVRALTRDNETRYTSDDVKRMYRILMTRSLEECYFLFVDEKVREYFENFGRPLN